MSLAAALRGLVALVVFATVAWMITSAQAFDYEEGQVWSYHTRSGEEGSRLYIVQIDRDIANAPIFHVYVSGLKIKNPRIAGGYQGHLPHSPVGEETLDVSVVELVEFPATMPDISEGYGHWREAFDEGGAGWFTIPVKEIIQIIEDVTSQQR